MKKILKLAMALLIGFSLMNVAFAAKTTQSLKVGHIGFGISPSQFAIYNYTGAQFTVTYQQPGQPQGTVQLYPAYSQGNPYGVAWTVSSYPYNYVTIYSVVDNSTGINYASGNGYGGTYWSINPYNSNAKTLIRVQK